MSAPEELPKSKPDSTNSDAEPSPVQEETSLPATVPEVDVPVDASDLIDATDSSDAATVGDGDDSSSPEELFAAPLVTATSDTTSGSKPGELVPPSLPRHDDADESVLAESRRHTRRSFLVAAVGATAAYSLYRHLLVSNAAEMQPNELRKAFEINADVSRTVFREHGLAPTYPLSQAKDLRVNGVFGLKKMLEPSSYRLQVVGSAGTATHPRYSSDVTAWEYQYTADKTAEDEGHDTKVDPKMLTAEKMAPEAMMPKAVQDEARTGRTPRGHEEAGESHSTLHVGTPGLLLTMDDVLKLPRHESVTQFKCIEGWSEIVHWAGVRMVDFLEAYPPALLDGKEPRYVYMETPDGDYYTGYDLEVCRHPQTLLVTEMMGAPLTQFHGAPLRLFTPTKYGYKQIKRIGLIAYTNTRPDDYWTKLGYDWYAGL